MSRVKIALIVIAGIIVVVGGVVGYFFSSIETKRNIKVVSNNPAEVIESLNKDGYNLTFLDRLYMRYFAPPLAGNVYINKTKLARYQFLKKLSYKSTHYTPITIIPGETTYFVLQDIAKKLNFNLIKLAKIYKEEAPFSEGNFLAETYNIPLYFDERATIKFLIKSSFKVYKRVLAQNKIEYSNKTLKRYLIIASIIQKEAANNKEMPLIASVIYNRLKKNMRLQMDGSLNYGKYSHQKITPERIKSDKSFYNTYKFKGLPKEPVCNVSLNALKAAINPAKSEYLYFMKKDEKSHSFSKEYKSHLNNIKKRKKELSKE